MKKMILSAIVLGALALNSYAEEINDSNLMLWTQAQGTVVNCNSNVDEDNNEMCVDVSGMVYQLRDNIDVEVGDMLHVSFGFGYNLVTDRYSLLIMSVESESSCLSSRID